MATFAVHTVLHSPIHLSPTLRAAPPRRRRSTENPIQCESMTLTVDEAKTTPLAAPEIAPAINDALVEQHLPQVQMIARKIRWRLHCTVELDELVGFGVIGLMQALDHFDPRRGNLFKTYAEHRIRGAILDGLRKMNWLSRSAYRQKLQYQQWQAEASEEVPTGRSMGEGSAAAVLCPPRKFDANRPLQPPLMEIVCSGTTLDELEKMAQRTGAAHSSCFAQDPEAIYERKEARLRLARAMSQLPHRSRRLLELLYYRDMSMKQVAGTLGVHPSRISQLHTAALRFLRQCLEVPEGVKRSTVAEGMAPA